MEAGLLIVASFLEGQREAVNVKIATTFSRRPAVHSVPVVDRCGKEEKNVVRTEYCFSLLNLTKSLLSLSLKSHPL